MRIRIAQVKVIPEKGNLEANHAVLMEVLEEIGSHSPDVLITPECFLDGYVVTEESVTAESLAEYAVDPATSPYTAAVSDWASKQRSWVIYGCSRPTPDGVTNSALIYNRNGELVGDYNKVHCHGGDMKFRAGTELPVYPSDFGLFGVLICADRRWPETVRTLALKGARIIFNPTYGMHDAMNFAMMRTRSFESEIIIAFTHAQQSLITGPKRMIYCNDEEDAHRFVITDVDLAHIDRIRARGQCHLDNLRPEVYELSP